MIKSEKEVLEFISHFQNEGTIKTFTEGCCYWFAKILEQRFPYSSHIYYHPIDNHFATKIEGKLYDVTGELPWTEGWVEWKKYYTLDHLDCVRVVRNCILKVS